MYNSDRLDKNHLWYLCWTVKQWFFCVFGIQYIYNLSTHRCHHVLAWHFGAIHKIRTHFFSRFLPPPPPLLPLYAILWRYQNINTLAYALTHPPPPPPPCVRTLWMTPFQFACLHLSLAILQHFSSVFSEAVDLCEIVPITPPRPASTSATMSNTDLISNHNREMEPLVFSDDPQCVSSPKLLSPADSSYCGTMKSDDSGIVMGR